MLQEEEEKKKEEEDRAKEIPVAEMNEDDTYKVDRHNFEKAILNNPHLDGMYYNIFIKNN